MNVTQESTDSGLAGLVNRALDQGRTELAGALLDQTRVDESRSASTVVAGRERLTRSLRPEPPRTAAADYLRYLEALLQIDTDLDSLAITLGASPEERLPLAERRSALRQKIAIALAGLGNGITSDRRGTVQALNRLFRLGRPLTWPLNGRYDGLFVTTNLGPGLDHWFGAWTGIWMPWYGKTFAAAEQRGENVFDAALAPFLRLFAPLYQGISTDGSERVRAFQFRTWSGPGLRDPEIDVFKIDYAIPGNPLFLVRQVLDELVEIADGAFLGKAHLRLPFGVKTAAYFALFQRPEEAETP